MPSRLPRNIFRRAVRYCLTRKTPVLLGAREHALAVAGRRDHPDAPAYRAAVLAIEDVLIGRDVICRTCRTDLDTGACTPDQCSTVTLHV